MSIKVVLDNTGPLYPGTLLKGNVFCEFNSSTSIRSIKIRCYGKEHTEWTSGGKNKTRYIGNHFFFQMETKLYEPENSEIAAGQYTYKFNFVLPGNLPSTFEFPYGYIRYSLKGIVDIPLAIDPRHRLDLPIISVLDIATLSPHLRQPYSATGETLMGCCWFYNTDPVRMEAQVNMLLFLPGERIKISLELHNMSSNFVEEVTVKIVRCFVAHAESPRHDTRFVDEDLLKMNLNGIGPHRQQTYDVDLFIPLDIAVPNMTGSQLIEGIYRLQVSGTTSGFNRNVDITIAEIQMGHIDSLQRANEASGYLNPLEIGNSAASAPPPTYDDAMEDYKGQKYLMT